MIVNVPSAKSPGVDLRILTEEEGKELFDKQARLNMSGDEFIVAWREGRFADDPDRPEIVFLAMLMPFAF